MDDVGPLSMYDARMRAEGKGVEERKDGLRRMQERLEGEREEAFQEGLEEGKGKGKESGKK